MKTPITSIKRLALALCFVTPLVSWAAPTATAVWRSNLGQSYTIGGNTFAVAPNGGALQEDGTIKMGTENSKLGATIALPAGTRNVSVLVKFSNLSIPTDQQYGTALATINDSSFHEVGVAAANTSSLNTYWHENGSSTYEISAVYSPASPAVVSSGYMLFSYAANNGSRCYMGETIAGLAGGENTTGHWSNLDVQYVSIGGPTALQILDICDNLVIEEVALFVGNYLTNNDVADYAFPSLDGETTALTMTELNTKIAADSNVIFTASPVVTLDVEPSDATKTYLQSAAWNNGTVLIKDVNKTNIVPSNYGNPNSTLKLSGVKGFFAKAKYANTVTPAIELEDSATDGREYGFWSYDGYGFNAYNGYPRVNTPELKGSGTYKCDKANLRVLLVADKFSAFSGKFVLSNGGAVCLETGVPTESDESVLPGRVYLGGSVPAKYSEWTVSDGFYGTVEVAANDTNNASDLFASSVWNGTVVVPAATNSTTGHIRIMLAKLGNANSVVQFNGLTSDSKDYYLNSGDSPTYNTTVDVNGWVAFANGSSGKTITFSKVTCSNADATLRLAFPGTDLVNYTITTLDQFAGTLSVNGYAPLTIGTINLATAPDAGAKVVKLVNGSYLKNVSSTKVSVNGVVDDTITLEVKSDGIYVAVPTVTITVPTVENASVVVSDGTNTYTPATAGGTSYSVPAGSTITVTYTAAEGYGLEGKSSYTLTNVAEGDAVTITDTEAKLYVAQFNNVKYTTVQGAINAWAAVTDQMTAYLQQVSLLGDVTESSVAIPVGAASMPCHINGGNHTLTAPVTIDEGAYLSPTDLTIAGNLTVNGTYYRIGPAAIAVSGALTFGDGATIAVTALSSETSVFDATGAVTISGDLNVSLYSDILTAGEYTIATGASVTRVAESQVVVTLNGTGTDTWALSNTETAVVLTGAAARVNGDTYPTFTEAVTAANGTDTIELLAAASYTLTAGETVIVKAGSFTFTVSAPQGYVISETTVSDGVVSYTTSSALVRTTREVYESGAWRTADGYPKEYASIVAAIAGITIAPVENSTRYTVTMLGNETLATRAEPNYSMTIDLGGYTLTREGTSGNGSVFDVKSGTVTIKNGIIDCTQDDTAIVADGVYAITARSGSAVTLDDLTVTVNSECGACVYPFAGATVTIKSGIYANITETPYRWKNTWTGMAVNQANVATQLLVIQGGTFSQINPALGDDSWADGAGTFVAAGYESTEDNGVWVVAALPNYTVTFDADGGTPAPAAQTVQKGSTATVPAEPTKENYTFAGWKLGGSAYDFATPVTGNITLVASWTSSGINPADPTSSQTVTPTADETAAAGGDAQAAAIAKAAVTVPTEASAYVDADTYKTYFNLTAEAGEAGAYTVTISGLKSTVAEDVDASAAAQLVSTAAEGDMTIAVKPGLYYGFTTGTTLTLAEPELTLATGETRTIAKPGTTQGFIKVKVSATP